MDIDFKELEKAIDSRGYVSDFLDEGCVTHEEQEIYRLIYKAAKRLLDIQKKTCVFGDNCDATIVYMKGFEDGKKGILPKPVRTN